MPTQTIYLSDEVMDALRNRASSRNTTPLKLAAGLVRAALGAGIEPLAAERGPGRPSHADQVGRDQVARAEALRAALQFSPKSTEEAAAMLHTHPPIARAILEMWAEKGVVVRVDAPDGRVFWALSSVVTDAGGAVQK